jgi:hypothetical protein
MTLYVFVGGPRDGETISQDAEPISSWTTLHGRYASDHPQQRTMTADGLAVILRFAPHIAR